MRQIVYISTATQVVTPDDPSRILAASNRNNSRDAITGLLYFDGKRFLQALEGDSKAVDRALARISADPRHRAIVILSDRDISSREFGDWAMAHRKPGSNGDAFIHQVAMLVESASPSLRATFTSFAELQRAA